MTCAILFLTMDGAIAEIKSKLDIVEFLGTFITLKKAGRNYKANCPFHNEKTPSFVISPDRQIWHCFGACQDGGDVITFFMKWENITFYEALKELALKTNTKLVTTAIEDNAWKQKERLFTINALAAKYYNYLLEHHAVAAGAREYLTERKVSDKLIKTFSLGYAPNSWDSLLTFMAKKKYSAQDLEAVGLAIKGSKGSYYDRFRGRIVFPLKDARGNILGFSGRAMGTVEGAKYVNTPETYIYHKRETLFGIDISRDAIRKTESVVLVEGEFDMISCFAYGIENAVAIKGSAVTKDQLILLSRLCKHIILALDSDFSGSETIKRAIKDAQALDFKIEVAVSKDGKDPDEAFKNNPIGYKKILNNPVNIYDFIIENTLSRFPKIDAFAKREIADIIIPFIANIENPIIKSHYIRRMSQILEVDEASVETSIRNYTKGETTKTNKRFVEEKSIPKKRHEIIEQYILSMVFQNEQPRQVLGRLEGFILPEDFSIGSYRKIYEKLLEYTGDTINPQEFSHLLPSELISSYNSLFLFESDTVATVANDFDRFLYEFKRIALKRRLKELINTTQEESENEQNNDSLIQKLTDELSAVEKKLVVL